MDIHKSLHGTDDVPADMVAASRWMRPPPPSSPSSITRSSCRNSGPTSSRTSTCSRSSSRCFDSRVDFNLNLAESISYGMVYTDRDVHLFLELKRSIDYGMPNIQIWYHEFEQREEVYKGYLPWTVDIDQEYHKQVSNVYICRYDCYLSIDHMEGLMVVTGSESPVVVVLSGSMEPGFKRGDILFLHMSKDPIRTGKIICFNAIVSLA
ncbi:hypothetical protein EJB05_26974 [Eragrostis curvula]|uniref:Signal peptidase complex catalytic subunit SEC11 n=1 Tax=Eragrostis curvula TaxID=38414 RepID=A0A5J9ULB7_9POAL|nr:hypothetical protein EJB05_26974 [Eragrostis curvula]